MRPTARCCAQCQRVPRRSVWTPCTSPTSAVPSAKMVRGIRTSGGHQAVHSRLHAWQTDGSREMCEYMCVQTCVSGVWSELPEPGLSVSSWCQLVLYGCSEFLQGEIQFPPPRKVTCFNLALFVLAKLFLFFQNRSNMLLKIICFSLLSKLNLNHN